MILYNSPSSTNSIEHVSIGNASGGFLGFQVDVGYNAGIPEPSSTTVTETADGTIEFNFAGLTPGQRTGDLLIQTNASRTAPGNFSIIDGSSTTVVGAIPAANVPEPSSIALLGTGLLGIAPAIRRRLI